MMLTLDRCHELIDEALASKTRDEFIEAAMPLLREYKILSFGIGRSSTHYRARIIENERFDFLKQVDYPPSHLVKRAGRLNDIGDPIFYISNNQETAIAEVLPQTGQLVQVSGYRIIPNKMLHVICVGEYQNVYKRGYTAFNGTDPGGTVKKLIYDLPYEKRQKRLLIDNFFAHVISDKDARDNDYVHSRALRDVLFSKIDAHAITFPSARDSGGVNIAVKPAPSDDLYMNVCCVIYRIGRKRRFSPFELELVGAATGLSDDRKKFIWESGETHEHLIMYNMTEAEYNNRDSINA